MYLTGVVIASRKAPDTRLIIELMVNGAVQVIAYEGSDRRRVQSGDYVIATDFGRSSSDGVACCKSLKTIFRDFDKKDRKAKNSTNNYRNVNKLEALRIRGHSIQHFQSTLGAQGYLPVSSPAIVSRWPDGNTIPFSINYYGTDARLSISNMIYHQIMVMHGFGKIYEVGKSFRNETPSHPNRLAEYTTFDISRDTPVLETVEKAFESLIYSLCLDLEKQDFKTLCPPSKFQFDRITYRELLARCGLESMPGAQLPLPAREYIAKNFESYLWVTNFPEYSRPFYARSRNGFCDDCQLWYRGKIYVAAGNVVEDDVESYVPKMIARKHKVENFEDYLVHVKNGVPPISQMAVGIERMLATWFDGMDAADFCCFPRYGKNISL